MHLPQKGRLYRNENVDGLYKVGLVQAGWGGDKHMSVIVRLLASSLSARPRPGRRSAGGSRCRWR